MFVAGLQGLKRKPPGSKTESDVFFGIWNSESIRNPFLDKEYKEWWKMIRFRRSPGWTALRVRTSAQWIPVSCNAMQRRYSPQRDATKRRRTYLSRAAAACYWRGVPGFKKPRNSRHCSRAVALSDLTDLTASAKICEDLRRSAKCYALLRQFLNKLWCSLERC